MDWSTLFLGLSFLAIGLVFRYFFRRTNYPNQLDFSEGSVVFKGDPYVGFLSLFMACAFGVGPYLLGNVGLQIATFPLVIIYLHYAYFAIFSSIRLSEDHTAEYKSLFTNQTFHFADIERITSFQSAIIIKLKNGKRIWLSTTLDHYQNLFGYLFANAAEKFSDKTRKKLEKRIRFTQVV